MATGWKVFRAGTARADCKAADAFKFAMSTAEKGMVPAMTRRSAHMTCCDEQH